MARRRLIRISTFLLAGAVFNVAIAWLLALFAPWPHAVPFGTYREGFTRHAIGYSDWFTDVSRAPGWTRVTSSWYTGPPRFVGAPRNLGAAEILPNWASLAVPATNPTNTSIIRILDARGWPAITFWSCVESAGFPGPAAPITSAVTITHGYLPPNERSRTFADWANLRIVPLAVLWPGLLVNSLFYATLLWLLFTAPYAIRRLARARRGLCLKCGYPVSGTTCSECGSVSRKPAVA